jgi:hypothetical protein
MTTAVRAPTPATTRSVELSWSNGGVVVAPVDDFDVHADVSPPSGAGRRDLRITVQHVGAVEMVASVRFSAALPGRTDEPWWLVPGVFYGDNGPGGPCGGYPRFAVGADDPAGMVSDHWEFRADRAATPAVFVWGATSGIALVTRDSSPVGLTGLGFGHDAATGGATVHLRFPYRESPVTYYGNGAALPAASASHVWRPGESVVFDLAVYELPADRHSYAAVLREEHALAAPRAPLHPWVDVPLAASLAAEGLARWHYTEPGVLLETVGFDRELRGSDGQPVDRQEMHVGWVSGVPWAYALLAHGRRVGSAAYAAAATKVIDFVCADLAPSGTFWPKWRRTGAGWSPVPGSVHSRTAAEATLFLVRALELDADLRVAHPRWRAAVRSNLDAVINRQRADGNLGAAHDALSGAVTSWEGCAGLAWVNALAEARREDGPSGARSAYLQAARRAGEYYARFVTAEFLNGAPEDVGLAPTSEDGYVALMAYLALHRRTGEARWLGLARRAADWMLTFRYSYNVAFPAGTLLDVYGFATRGADNASPANQHLHAYGLVCSAELAELSRLTGDGYYASRAREAFACFRQFIARFDGDFNAYRGMATERYYQTACFQPKGMLLTLSHAWSVGVLLLACEQALAEPALLAAAS